MTTHVEQSELIDGIKDHAAAVAAMDHPHQPPTMVYEFVQFAIAGTVQFGETPEDAAVAAAGIASGNHHQGLAKESAAAGMLADEWLRGKIQEYIDTGAAK